MRGSTSQDSEHMDTVTGLLTLLLGHRTVSTPDTRRAAPTFPRVMVTSPGPGQWVCSVLPATVIGSGLGQ